MEQTTPSPPTPTMPDLDPITGAADRSADPPDQPSSPADARSETTNPGATATGRRSPQQSELEQIGRRFEVALRHPFHTADRDPAQVEALRQRGRGLLEKQARHAAESRRGHRDEPEGFSLTRFRDRLVDKVESLLTRQEVSPAARGPSR